MSQASQATAGIRGQLSPMAEAVDLRAKSVDDGRRHAKFDAPSSRTFMIAAKAA